MFVDPDAVLDIPALRVLFPEVPAGTLRSWASVGRLERRGTDRRGRTLYRVGDVTRLAVARKSKAGR